MLQKTAGAREGLPSCVSTAAGPDTKRKVARPGRSAWCARRPGAKPTIASEGGPAHRLPSRAAGSQCRRRRAPPARSPWPSHRRARRPGERKLRKPAKALPTGQVMTSPPHTTAGSQTPEKVPHATRKYQGRRLETALGRDHRGEGLGARYNRPRVERCIWWPIWQRTV